MKIYNKSEPNLCMFHYKNNGPVGTRETGHEPWNASEQSKLLYFFFNFYFYCTLFTNPATLEIRPKTHFWVHSVGQFGAIKNAPFFRHCCCCLRILRSPFNKVFSLITVVKMGPVKSPNVHTFHRPKWAILENHCEDETQLKIIIYI